MKKLLLILPFLLLGFLSIAQVPQKMSYQAVVRNSTNTLVINSPVGMQISILQGSATGTAVYVETHNPTTNDNGLVSLEIGNGTVVSGVFASIDWANGPFFIKTETDPAGGNNFLISGTTQLLSVPYSFFAGNGIKGYSNTGDTLYLSNGQFIIIPGISSANNFSNNQTCDLSGILNQSLNYDSIQDIDGNIYKTIQIGNQRWMAENLRVTKFSNGDVVSNNLDTIVTCGQNPSPNWLYYDNNPLNNCPYGKLYNGYVVLDSRNVCPSGWHIPSNSDWNQMVKYLDPNADTTSTLIFPPQSSYAGGLLKSTGTSLWTAPNSGAANTTGFSTVPSGIAHCQNGSYNLNTQALFWTSHYVGFGFYIRILQSDDSGIFFHAYAIRSHLSIRCIED
jgi:uncharacterized protein (TIGR02145 family)